MDWCVHSSSLSSVFLPIRLRPRGTQGVDCLHLLFIVNVPLHGFLYFCPNLICAVSSAFHCNINLSALEICIWYLQALATASLHFQTRPSVWEELIYFHHHGAEFPAHAMCLSAANICWLFFWLTGSGPVRGNDAERFARDPSAGWQHYYWQGWEGTSQKHSVTLIGFPLNKKQWNNLQPSQ